MRNRNWKGLGWYLAIAGILAGNLIGINALATEEGETGSTLGSADAPPGVLVGYLPRVERVKTGEHFEYFGWVGAPFSRLVIDYKDVLCCKRTYRAMDGCKDLPICTTRS
jgi:hypothetical protein